MLARNHNTQTEAVKELWTDIALLRVHRADEYKTRRMRIGHALALHRVHTHSRSIQQHIDNMVVQQIDFINIENITVRLRQNACLKLLLAMLNRMLYIQRAHNAILCRADRQLYNAHLQRFLRQTAS